jgi:hypothetical protein
MCRGLPASPRLAKSFEGYIEGDFVSELETISGAPSRFVGGEGNVQNRK